MRLKKLSGVVLAAVMTVGMCSTAFAADTELSNGDYTGTIHFLNGNGSGKLSMCDPIFAHEADIELTDDTAELTFYVAYPIPSFADQGTDGTLKDVVMTIDGTQYKAESDITTKAVKTFDTDASLFGIKAGDQLATQALTLELPRSAVDNLKTQVETSAYVNVFMNSTQNFFVQVTDLKAAALPDTPSENTQNMEISADVEEQISEPSYTVTVPASVAMGTLSTEEDNTQAYKVLVKASDLDGTLSVTAPETGNLNSDKNALAFANSLGTKNVTAVFREIKALAFVLAAGMLLQPASVNASSESMKISADIVQEDQKPSYMVVVPSSVALGSLSTQTDTVQNYEVRIKTTDAKGTIEVSAPESGVLHNQENTLEFTNNFGKQQITADQVREANAAGGEQILQGALTIAAEEVSGAKAGNYTGTTTFAISYAANK